MKWNEINQRFYLHSKTGRIYNEISVIFIKAS